jgi:uncharacterized membrane protein YoaK (UPF0700 family)
MADSGPDAAQDLAQDPAAGHGLRFALSLAVTAGFADAFGYFTLHGLLTAHVTGNLAFMAVGLAEGRPHVIMKILALPLFMLGVGAATAFISWVGRHSRQTLAWPLALEAGLFLLGLAAGAALPPCRSTDDLTGICLGTILIMAMATQNAVMRLSLKTLPSTTAMTTNVAEATVQWTRRLVGFGQGASAEERQALLARARMTGLTVSAFALGAIAGALSAVRLGDVGLLIPTAILACLAGASARL